MAPVGFLPFFPFLDYVTAKYPKMMEVISLVVGAVICVHSTASTCTVQSGAVRAIVRVTKQS